MTKMSRQRITVGTFLIAVCLAVIAAEERNESPGFTSTGLIRVTLEITEEMSAGFLQTNLDDEEGEFRTLLSSKLVQTLRNEVNTTIPLCVMSSGGGYFEVTSYDIPSNDDSKIISEFGDSIPVSVSFGEDGQESIKYRSVDDECTSREAIPVTIHLNKQLSGEEIGLIHGQLNLLVKSE